MDELQQRIEKLDRAAQRERLSSPEIVQKTKAVRYSGSIHLAYCKEDAPADTVITCYLDIDETGEEIEVQCSTTPSGTNLENAAPLLKDGDLVFVIQKKDVWYCIGKPFFKMPPCT